MTDRHEIARDFLLQHFKPEELPEVMAHVLRAAEMHAEASLMAHPDESLRILTTAWEVWATNRETDVVCPNCALPCDEHDEDCELLGDLCRLAGPDTVFPFSETPPRTSPPTYGRCDKCGETMSGNDPDVSPLADGTNICVFCGYWNIPPGPARESLRAERNPGT